MSRQATKHDNYSAGESSHLGDLKSKGKKALNKLMLSDHLDLSKAEEWGPLPRDYDDLCNQAQQLGLMGSKGKEASKTTKGKLFGNLLSSHQIKRSINKVSLVLVGDSGVGKSSTINLSLIHI